MAAEDIRLPTVTASRRRDPERIALGDTVTIEDGPQLHQHLSEKVSGQSFGIGTAIHPGTTVALGLGIDAAILAVNGKKLGVSMLRYCSFTMERRVSIDRPLRATGRVAELGARHVECVSEVWQDDHVVCKARIGLCQVRDGQATPLSRYYLTDPSSGPEAEGR
jgi:hypothetical protein